jgi:peptidoglycan/xylan/chitin deacetylase (PgdA/CDA1 family)
MDTEGKSRIQSYTAAGFSIANHTHSHPNFNNVSLEEFSADFLLADATLAPVVGFLQLFRFPYLREGNTLEKRNGFRKLLNEKNYKNAHVTINTYDWHMDSLYQKAQQNKEKIHRENLQQWYVDTLFSAAEFYDNLALQVIKRSPKHILLLHENDLAALHLPALIRHFQEKGWKWISVSDALNDPISKIESDRLFPNNPGRVGEIAANELGDAARGKLWHESCNESFLEQSWAKYEVSKK